LVVLVDYVILSIILFAIGIYGLISKGNALRLVFAIEIVINAANINLVAFSTYLTTPNSPNAIGQTFALFSIAIAAAEAAVGLAIIVVAFRLNKNVDVFRLRKLKH
jgi:NAD(P)H-quinone oxidoreductase subunit 4L